MDSRTATALVCLISSSLAPAQRQVVCPSANASTEGGSRISFPFAGNGALRYQQICSIPGQVGVISQVAFRRDNDAVVASGNYSAFSPDFDLVLSSSPRTPVTISKTFANNHGSDVRIVHSGVLNWPADNKVPPGPTPFAYTVPIALPFLCLGLQDLCVEVNRRAYTNPNTLFFLDASASSVGTGIRKLGDGCPAGAFNLVQVYDNWAPGAYARVLQYNAATSSPVALVLGDSATNLGGYSLPLDLGIIGVPGCSVYTNLLLSIAGLNSTASGPYAGRWEFATELPNNPALSGQQLFLQFYNLNDVNIGNALNLSLSQGYGITFAAVQSGIPAVGEAHGTPSSADAQLVQQGYGFVTQFTF